MASMITSEFIFNSINEHLKKREDLWHVVNGPKRETWFTAESIAALSHCSLRELSQGYRVFGEENYSAIIKLIKKENFTIKYKCNKSRKIPDVSIIENCTNPESAILTIMEAKLISLVSTKKDTNWDKLFKTEYERTSRQINEGSGISNKSTINIEEDYSDMELSSDLKKQLKALNKTSNNDGLFEQLKMANKIFPKSQAYGLIFAVHRTGQSTFAKPCNLFDRLKQEVNDIYKDSDWCLWNDEFRFFDNQRHIRAIGGMFDNDVSIGMGILQEKIS